MQSYLKQNLKLLFQNFKKNEHIRMCHKTDNRSTCSADSKRNIAKMEDLETAIIFKSNIGRIAFT